MSKIRVLKPEAGKWYVETSKNRVLFCKGVTEDAVNLAYRPESPIAVVPRLEEFDDFFTPVARAGMRVVVDDKTRAVVKQAYPEGSTSYLFPHYKLDYLFPHYKLDVDGDKNVAVAMSRVRASLA
jgi:hypothetical protein